MNCDADVVAKYLRTRLQYLQDCYTDIVYHSYYYFFVGHFTYINSGEYLAVRFEAADGFMHYGWIGVTVTQLNDVHELSAFAWGYETDPMTPIAAGAVPAPGTLAALAFGAAAALGRRKREDA